MVAVKPSRIQVTGNGCVVSRSGTDTTVLSNDFVLNIRTDRLHWISRELYSLFLATLDTLAHTIRWLIYVTLI